MQSDQRPARSELGILRDSQVYPGGGVDEETGWLVVKRITDCTAVWPLSELETIIRAEQQQATDEAEQRDYENLVLTMAAAKDDIAKAADEVAAQELVYWGIEIGRLLARIEVRPDRKSIDTGRTIRKVNADKARLTAKLTVEQWTKIAAHIRKEANRGISASQTCRRVSGELSKGQFDGLLQVRIEISARALQQRWTDRNK